MEKAGWDADRIRSTLAAARGKDHRYDTGRVLGSMCTQPHPLALEAFHDFQVSNLGDPDHFPGTAGLEREVLADLLQLTAAPDGAGARLLSGGTEANILACFLAREATGRKTIVLSEATHFSFVKAARLLGMHLKRIPCGADLRSDPTAMAAAFDEDTALVIAVAGSTELGLVDDVAAIAALAAKNNIPCHVDAAFGGYVLPFIETAAWDFRVPGVTSISLDPHKMGQAVVPAGALVLRDETAWASIAVETDYVSTSHQSTLMGTRPGAAAAATWAAHRALGWTGYGAAIATCMEVRDVLAEGLRTHGFALVAEPELNVVTFAVENPAAVLDALDARGIRVNVVPRFSALRIVVGPHVSMDAAHHFLSVLGDL